MGFYRFCLTANILKFNDAVFSVIVDVSEDA